MDLPLIVTNVSSQPRNVSRQATRPPVPSLRRMDPSYGGTRGVHELDLDDLVITSVAPSSGPVRQSDARGRPRALSGGVMMSTPSDRRAHHQAIISEDDIVAVYTSGRPNFIPAQSIPQNSPLPATNPPYQSSSSFATPHIICQHVEMDPFPAEPFTGLDNAITKAPKEKLRHRTNGVRPEKPADHRRFIHGLGPRLNAPSPIVGVEAERARLSNQAQAYPSPPVEKAIIETCQAGSLMMASTRQDFPQIGALYAPVSVPSPFLHSYLPLPPSDFELQHPAPLHSYPTSQLVHNQRQGSDVDARYLKSGSLPVVMSTDGYDSEAFVGSSQTPELIAYRIPLSSTPAN